MSVATFDPQAAAVSLTERAVRYFESKLATAPEKIVRLSTEKSGCTGYAYVLGLADGAEASDEVIQCSDALTVAVAEDAVGLLRGTEIDLVTEGVNQVIKYNNPNVVAECGCGESFSVSD